MSGKAIEIGLLVVGLAASFSLSAQSGQPKAPVGTAPASAIKAASSCPPSFWTHTYKPERLFVAEKCVSVTGTIVDATVNQTKHWPDGVRHEPDGDTHGWLKVDAPFESMLNAGNKGNENGNLVFEIVCYWTPPIQDDAKAACAGYQNKIKLPPVGSHVTITGQYVEDDNHAHWMEIHPVVKIAVIR